MDNIKNTSKSDLSIGNIACDNERKNDEFEGWWCSRLEARNIHGYDSPTHCLPSSGSRVFRGGIYQNIAEDDIWDVSDLLIEMTDQERRRENFHSAQLRGTPVPALPRFSSPQAWLAADRSNGFVAVHRPHASDTHPTVIPCHLTTTVNDICHQLCIATNAMHVVFGGRWSRRLGSTECPLALQNDYVAGLGHTAIADIQEEGTNQHLKHLLKFYSGKPPITRILSSNRLQAELNVKKGGLLKHWVNRLCILSDSRLFIYKDKNQTHDPFMMQLAGGTVEEVVIKGRDYCIRLSSGENQVFLAMENAEDYNKWFARCTKAVKHVPLAADLSNCNLECLPENLLMSETLEIVNLSNNSLRERFETDTVHTEGWLDDLPRFTQLSSVNLANNHLNSFPLSLCAIATLAELNLAGNQLTEVPSDIKLLTSLRVLHLHNNHLSSLPDELVGVRCLNSLALAFNRFALMPPAAAQVTNIRLTDVDCVSMAGNQMERLSSEILAELKYARRIDFRFNALALPTVDTLKFSVLDRLTHLNVSDNFVAELDLHSLRVLEYLSCERNGMVSLHLSGAALRTLMASDNRLEYVEIVPKPESLLLLDLSRNCLEKLPDWLSDCLYLNTLDVSHNRLSDLPQRLLSGCKKLRVLRAAYNQLVALPSDFDVLFLEKIELQQNELTALPGDLLIRANRLKVLNLTRNNLPCLPLSNNKADLNRIEELYLSRNELGNDVMEVVSSYPRLKVLHLAYNELNELYDSEVKKLRQLRELNVSGNQLTMLPPSLGSLSSLCVLRAHSNALHSLPDLRSAKALGVLDVSYNQLLNVTMAQLIVYHVNLFDIAQNSQLKLGQDELKSVKLCIAVIRILNFSSDGDSLFGMFDGHDNDDVPSLMIQNISSLQHAKKRHSHPAKFMKYAILTLHSKLLTAGQQCGASAALVHLQRQTIGGTTSGRFALNVANVGDVESVLCRRGEPLMLTRCFTTSKDRDDCLRVRKADGVIAEDGRVDGITTCTRQVGFYQLYPHVVPDPHVVTVPLHNDDEFLVIANAEFWSAVTPAKAVSEIYDIRIPSVAAKKLQDLAQGFGARGPLSVLVVRLNSIHCGIPKSDASTQKAKNSVFYKSENQTLRTASTGVASHRPPPEPPRTSNPLKALHGIQFLTSSSSSAPAASAAGNDSSAGSIRKDLVPVTMGNEGSSLPGSSSVEIHTSSNRNPTTHVGKQPPPVAEKPVVLRNRFTKRGSKAIDLESISQNRLPTGIHVDEVGRSNKSTILAADAAPLDSSSLASLSSADSSVLSHNTKSSSTGDETSSSVVATSVEVVRGTLRCDADTVNPSWSIRTRSLVGSPMTLAPNPAYAAFGNDDDTATDHLMIEMMSSKSAMKKRLSVANVVAIFEPTKQPPVDSESISSSSSIRSKKSASEEQTALSTSSPASSLSASWGNHRSLLNSTPNQSSSSSSKVYRASMMSSAPYSSSSVSSSGSHRDALAEFEAVEMIEENGEVKVIDIARL